MGKWLLQHRERKFQDENPNLAEPWKTIAVFDHLPNIETLKEKLDPGAYLLTCCDGYKRILTRRFNVRFFD